MFITTQTHKRFRRTRVYYDTDTLAVILVSDFCGAWCCVSDAESRVCERTLKYFQGIAGQCWVLSFDWVTHSLQAGHFLPEVQHIGFSPSLLTLFPFTPSLLTLSFLSLSLFTLSLLTPSPFTLSLSLIHI